MGGGVVALFSLDIGARVSGSTHQEGLQPRIGH